MHRRDIRDKYIYSSQINNNLFYTLLFTYHLPFTQSIDIIIIHISIVKRGGGHKGIPTYQYFHHSLEWKT